MPNNDNVRGVPVPAALPTFAPLRVSSTRDGVNGTNDDVGGGGGGGGGGGPVGVTDADGVDAAPVPTVFVATTVNAYPVPFVKPYTVHDNAPVVVQILAPGFDVTR